MVEDLLAMGYISQGLSQQFLSELNIIAKKVRKWAEEIGFYNLTFDPHTVKIPDKREFKLCYPKEFVMPEENARKAV